MQILEVRYSTFIFSKGYDSKISLFNTLLPLFVVLVMFLARILVALNRYKVVWTLTTFLLKFVNMSGHRSKFEKAAIKNNARTPF